VKAETNFDLNAMPQSLKIIHDLINISIELYKEGRLQEAQNKLKEGIPLLDNTAPDIGSHLFQRIASLNFLTGDKISLVAYLLELGKFLLESSLHKNARDAFETALAIEPQNKEISFLVAKTVVLSGDFPLGIPLVKKAIDSDPTNKEAFLLLIKACCAVRPESALPYVNGLLKLSPDDPLAHNEVARVYELLGMTAEAIGLRISVMELIKDRNELKTHLLESERLYPYEPAFHKSMLELEIEDENWTGVDTELTNLVRVAKRTADLKSALIYDEMRLAIDTKSQELIDEVKGLRKTLGFQPSSMIFSQSPTTTLEAEKRNLMLLEFQHYINHCTNELQEALSKGNLELAEKLRHEWLIANEFKHIIETRFEGNRSTNEDVWAKLMTCQGDIDEVRNLREHNPNSLPVLKKLFDSVKNDLNSIISVWIEMAENAKNSSDWQAVNSYLSLLSESIPSLAAFFKRIRPILLASVRE
jgi:tetratricopeptide (TPR) repeat protein